jgi:hypothetical protein
MKEITADSIKAFIASHDIPFAATQPKLSIPIIFRMCQKMLHGITFEEIKVHEDLIINGHHRYLSALMMDFALGHVPSNTTSATEPIAWDSVEFDEEDWDTEEEVEALNELDAKYNNQKIEFMRQITLR